MPSTSYIITVFIINVHPIKVIILDNLHELRSNLLFFAKAVIPAVVHITIPTSSHPSSTERKDHLLSGILPLLNQRRIWRVIANDRRSNVALCITIVLASCPSVRNCKRNHNVGVWSYLSCGWTRLPIAQVGNQSRIVSSHGSSGRWSWCRGHWWSRVWSGWRWRWRSIEHLWTSSCICEAREACGAFCIGASIASLTALRVGIDP
mmetsp:Transcript_29063/g.41543  ORF Transcript_29063/g.41543 Transcript_29063/m.41543 type:complete len:206 (-) Transcript_29063:404-1021(-)